MSARAFREFERFLADHPDTPAGWIDVVADRELSSWVAEETGVDHASPQTLLIRDGAVAWDASHFAITAPSLSDALRRGDVGAG